MSFLEDTSIFHTTLDWTNITYKFGLFLQGYLHPLLPEVKKVHDGTEDSQSPLFFWRGRTKNSIQGHLTSRSSDVQISDIVWWKKITKKKPDKKKLLGDRRSFSEKSYTKHIGRNCCLKEIKKTTDKTRCTVDTHLTIHFLKIILTFIVCDWYVYTLHLGELTCGCRRS